MSKEELDIQKEIEKYFTESTGFGRDKIANFMDIVNKALKQKGERIEELEKENKTLEGCLLAEQENTLMLENQIEKMKCCYNCKSFKGYGETCEGWGEPVLNPNCDCTEWELRR